MSEGNTIHDVVGFVVYQFQFDVFLITSDDFAGSVVVYIQGSEYGFVVVGAERIEFFQVKEELGSDMRITRSYSASSSAS